MSFSELLTEGAQAQAALARLAWDLDHPLMDVGIRELGKVWSFDLLRFTCARPSDMEDFPELSERLRGAFGAALHRQPQPVTATGRLRPHARDILFAALGQSETGEGHAKPVVIRGWIERQHLIVELRLFGWAMAWRHEAATAMLDALQSGVALKGGRRALRCAVEPEHVEHRRVSFVDLPAGTSQARLRFRSPVGLRQRARTHGDPRAILAAALPRIERMARWQACRLVVGGGWWKERLDRLQVSGENWRRLSWDRFTRNQGGTAVPMSGFLGDLVVDGWLDDVALVLALAETCNVGSHAALGMGWFDAVFY